MENDFGDELVRPVPRRKEIVWYYSGEPDCTLTEAVVGEGIAAGTPRIEIIAIVEDFLVEGCWKLIDENPAGSTLVVVVVDGSSGLLNSAVLSSWRFNNDGLDGGEGSGVVASGDGYWSGEATEVAEEEDLDE